MRPYTPPVPPELRRYLDWLASHGVAPQVTPEPPRLADHDALLIDDAGPLRTLEIPGCGAIEEVRDKATGLAADHATELLAHCLSDPRVNLAGREAWDIGCGTGVLMAAAARLGARPVLGTDVDPKALELAQQTLTRSGVAGELIESPLMDAIPSGRRADVLMVNLPHKPVPAGYALLGAQNGGEDGVAVHSLMRAQLAERLRPGGQMVFSQHSLPHPRMLAHYAQELDLTLLAWRRRYIQPGEYGTLHDVFRQRAAAGTSLLFKDEDREYLLSAAWLGDRQ